MILAYSALFVAGFALLRVFGVPLDVLETPFFTEIMFGPIGAVILLAFGLAMLAVSWAASTAIYRRKEF